MPIESFSDLQAFLDAFSETNDLPMENSPHLAFWKLDYKAFVGGNVPHVEPAMRICVPGDPKKSAFYLALAGIDPFDGSQFSQMPRGGPFMSAVELESIAQWIAKGAPQ